jgi:hypothetical protein
MASGIFNAHAGKAFKKAFEKLTTAIRQQDMQAIESLLPKVVQSPCYGRGRYRQMLVQAAMDTDNKDILMKVLGDQPDFLFTYAVTDGRMNTHTESLLYKALKEHRYNIAMFLAQHPGVDITVGSNKHGMGYSGINSPMSLAKENGMDDIAEVICKRRHPAPGACGPSGRANRRAM